jgi:transcriptional regulator with XRE-family HTH domain
MSQPAHRAAPKGLASNGPIPAGIGERIRQARQDLGMTQQALARAVGVTRSAVAQWETARAGQVSGNLTRIASVLGVSVGHLLQGTAPAPARSGAPRSGAARSGRAEPGAPAGDAVAETATEMALLRLFRRCGEEDRALLLRTAARLARQNLQR